MFDITLFCILKWTCLSVPPTKIPFGVSIWAAWLKNINFSPPEPTQPPPMTSKSKKSSLRDLICSLRVGGTYGMTSVPSLHDKAKIKQCSVMVRYTRTEKYDVSSTHQWFGPYDIFTCIYSSVERVLQSGRLQRMNNTPGNLPYEYHHCTADRVLCARSYRPSRREHTNNATREEAIVLLSRHRKSTRTARAASHPHKASGTRKRLLLQQWSLLLTHLHLMWAASTLPVSLACILTVDTRKQLDLSFCIEISIKCVSIQD